MPRTEGRVRPVDKRPGKAYAPKCRLCRGTGEIVTYTPGKGNSYSRCPEGCLPEFIGKR